MDLGLTGKVVLITGGSKGIGLACARAFAAEGARVAICSRDQANLDRALADLNQAFGFAADLVDPEAAAALVQAVESRVGPVDVLVNSAGAAGRMAPEDLTPQAWRTAMDAKYFTTINVLDPLVKRMAARGHGVIINVIGVGGKVASPAHLAGGAANAALMLVTAGAGHRLRGARDPGGGGQPRHDRDGPGGRADPDRCPAPGHQPGGSSGPGRGAHSHGPHGRAGGDRPGRGLSGIRPGELRQWRHPHHGRCPERGRFIGNPGPVAGTLWVSVLI